jgi:hypothetical protein
VSEGDHGDRLLLGLSLVEWHEAGRQEK